MLYFVSPELGRIKGLRKRNKVSVEKKFEIIMFKDANPRMSQKEIAEKFGVSKGVIQVMSKPAVREKIIEAMKNPHMSKLKSVFSTCTKWDKESLKKNLPVSERKLELIKEEREQKLLERKKESKPRTCIRNGRTRITLSEKLQYIKRYEEMKAENPELTDRAASRKLGLHDGTIRSMVLISDQIKRALLIPETADMISIPREKVLRKMFDDAGLEFPPLTRFF